MTQSADLLRLLEPAVRPVSPVKPTAPTKSGERPGQLPFESRDFDSLLAEARQNTPTLDGVDQTSESPAEPTPPSPLDPLADFGRIENPGLRELLAQQRGLGPNTNSAHHAA